MSDQLQCCIPISDDERHEGEVEPRVIGDWVDTFCQYHADDAQRIWNRMFLGELAGAEHISNLVRTLRQRGRDALRSDPHYLLQTAGGPVGMRGLVLADIIGHDGQVIQEHIWFEVKPVWLIPFRKQVSMMDLDPDPVAPTTDLYHEYTLQNGVVTMSIDRQLLPYASDSRADLMNDNSVQVIYVTYRRSI